MTALTEQLADQLRARAEAEGVQLLGPEGLVSQVTRAMFERALGVTSSCSTGL